MGGELNGRQENNSSKDGEARKFLAQGLDSTNVTRLRDGWHKNNLPKDGESNSKHENNSPKGWTVQK